MLRALWGSRPVLNGDEFLMRVIRKEYWGWTPRLCSEATINEIERARGLKNTKHLRTNAMDLSLYSTNIAALSIHHMLVVPRPSALALLAPEPHRRSCDYTIRVTIKYHDTDLSISASPMRQARSRSRVCSTSHKGCLVAAAVSLSSSASSTEHARKEACREGKRSVDLSGHACSKGTEPCAQKAVFGP